MSNFNVLNDSMVLLNKSPDLDWFDKAVLCEIPKTWIKRLSDKYDLHDMSPELALIRNGVISSSWNIIETQKWKELSYSVFRLLRSKDNWTLPFLEVCKDWNKSPLVWLELYKDHFEVLWTSIWTAKKYYSQLIDSTFFN